MQQWFRENPPSVDINRTVKFAIGGRLVSGEFHTVTSGAPTAVLQGFRDKQSGDIIKHRVIQASAIASDLTKSLAGGGMAVYNQLLYLPVRGRISGL
jgi:hypothetical protein